MDSIKSGYIQFIYPRSYLKTAQQQQAHPAFHQPSKDLDSSKLEHTWFNNPHNKIEYKLFDIDANTFFTSRDVTFHESVLPFCQQSRTQSLPPLQDIFPDIDIDLSTHVQHSPDPPSSPTRHNALEPIANQPSSPTPRSLTPITEPSPTDLPVRRSSCISAPPSWLQGYVTESQDNHSTTT